MPTTTTNRTDIYTRVTNQIVSELEKGVRPWLKPWNVQHTAGRISRPLRHNGSPFNGINILILWASAEDQGFASPYWLTFKQCQELGGRVKKGEKGSPVVYANTFTISVTTAEGAVVEEQIPFLKQFFSFNSEQCENLPERFTQIVVEPRETIERIAAADQFFTNTGADIRTGGNQAYYSVTHDYIQMPPIECFRDAEAHAATVSHELTHWTRHESRLNRDLGRKRYADAGYSLEELVAELGSAFLCADLAITPEVRPDHASYIHSWLEVLKQDKRAIFTAASHASKAVDYLHSLQPQPEA